MCVTVLQSQPSVSIPTLTIHRTSRPGGWSGRSSFSPVPQSLPDTPAGPADPRPRCLADRIEREPHPSHFIPLRLPGIRLVNHFGIDADRVHAAIHITEAFDLGRRNAGRALFSASHSYTTLAILVVLHTRMNTGGRGSSRFRPFVSFLFPQPAQHRDRMMGILEDRLRLGIGPLPAPFRRR